MTRAEKLIIPVFENQDTYKARLKIDEIKKYQIDFSPWAEDHANITNVTWTVKSGQATVSSQALSSNIASAIITFTQHGRSIIEVKAETGSEVKTIWFDLFTHDPSKIYVYDYGIGLGY